MGESPKKKQREEHNKEVTQTTPPSWIDLIPTWVWSRNFRSTHIISELERNLEIIQYSLTILQIEILTENMTFQES